MKISIPSEKSNHISTKVNTEPKNVNYIYSGLKVGIVIPAYNEELNIGKTLELIPTNISDKLNVIVIDDGSVDKTSEIASYFNVILIRHPHNKGYGAAVRTGLEYCRNNKFEIAIILDADGQHNPKYIKDFIKPILEDNIDFVIGNRFNYYYEMESYKKLSLKTMTALYMVFLHKKIMDPTNGYRALTLKVLENLELESEYSISQEMLFKIIPYYNYKQIPIIIKQRDHGKSFIKMRNYFSKIILLFIKYYIFPKIKGITHRIFSKKFRDRVRIYILKT
ncbi:MAG: glycosyltransferase family 2 protein [Promethearchaeota archaeon]